MTDELEFAGLRVFLVEDEPLVLMDMEDMLSDLGCRVAETASHLDAALQGARTSEFDLALLDINLGGERSDPAAAVIADRGIPVVFTTGYGRDQAAVGIAGPLVEKPLSPAKLRRALRAAMAETMGRTR